MMVRNPGHTVPGMNAFCISVSARQEIVQCSPSLQGKSSQLGTYKKINSEDWSNIYLYIFYIQYFDITDSPELPHINPALQNLTNFASNYLDTSDT